MLAETRLTDPDARKRLRQAISEVAVTLLGMPPDDIMIAPPHTVPKTSSGKLRRSAAREIYEGTGVGARERALWWQLIRLSLAGAPYLLRRGLKTALGHIFALYWWSSLCLTAAIAWPVVLLLPGRSLRHAALRGFARIFFKLTVRSLDIEADAPLPKEGAVLVANHSSYLDGVALAAALPGEFAFVAKEELKDQIVAGTFLRRLGTVFVRRTDPKGGVEDTTELLKAARAGERLVTFPEGTLTRMPGLLSFRLGAFLVAAQSGCPAVPITIRGTRSIMRGGQWFPRPGHISIHIGKPMMPEGTDFESAVHLRDAVRGVILERCQEPDLGAERVRL